MEAQDGQLGPIDIVVIGYSAGAPMTGEAAGLLVDLVDRGIIRVLDVLYENRWAAPFIEAVHRNGGQALAFERIPAQELIDALDAAESAPAS